MGLIRLTDSPYSIGADHNYAIAVYSSTYPDLDPDTASVDSTYQKAGVNCAASAKKLREIAPSVHQTISRAMLRVGPAASAGDFIRVDYHQSTNDRAADLIDLEESVYAPMFKHIVAEGKGPKAWSLVAPVLPLSSELGYHLYTTQVYKDNASLGRGLGLNQEVFTKIHPGRSYLNTMQHSRELDKMVKVRIYRVIDTVGAPVMPR